MELTIGSYTTRASSKQSDAESTALKQRGNTTIAMIPNFSK